MSSAEALVTISLGSGDYAPGEIIHGLTAADLEDLKGFVRELTPGEAFEAPEGTLLSVEGDDIVDPAVDGIPGVDSGAVVKEDPIVREGEDSGASEIADAPEEVPGVDSGDLVENDPVKRIGEIGAAIDLLEDGDFTAAGRPKVAALTAVLGFKPEADDVTAALALRKAEGQ